jgi:hypothetical protein
VTLSPATIYQTAHGPSLYVRTEQRPGDDHPHHLFVRAAKRVVLQHWTDTVPPEAELVVDREGRKQANEERWLRLAAEHECQILAGLLKKACSMLPPERASALRAEYLTTRPTKEQS